MVILFDERKTRARDLFSVSENTGDLIRFVDVGDVNLNQATLQVTQAILSIVFLLLQGTVNPFRFNLANFATKNATNLSNISIILENLEFVKQIVLLLLLRLVGHLLNVNFSTCNLD